MRLLLIRHGQTPDNVKGALGTSRPGPGLTDLGLKQAGAIPAALIDENLDAIYVSVLQRTLLTAEPLALARGFEPLLLDGIHEIPAGEFEGRSDPDAVHAYMGTIASWADTPEARVPGSETGVEFLARYDSAMRHIASQRSGTVAVLSHGAAIRAWTASVLRKTASDRAPLQHLANTGEVIVEGSATDGWHVVSWTDAPLGGAALQDAAAPDPTGEASE